MDTITIIRAIYIIADVLLLVYALKAFRKEEELGIVVGTTMLAGFAVVTSYTVSLFADSYFYMSLFNSCLFFFIDIMLLLFVRYILVFCKLEYKVDNKIIKIGLGAILFMEFIVLLLNPFEEIAVTFNGYELNGVMLYTYQAKPYFYFHLGFCYFLVLVGVSFLIYKIRITPKSYRKRYTNTLVSFLVVVLMNFLFLAGMELFSIDFSCIFYALIALFIYNSTFRFKDDFVALNRNTLFEHLGLPIILFDYEQVLNDYNQHALSMFPYLEDQRYTLKSFLEKVGIKLGSLNNNEEFKYKYVGEETEKFYHGEYVCYKEDDGKFAGGMLIFHDVTASQMMLEKEQGMSRTKTNFLVNVSSGIKKPLVAIINGAETLKQGEDDPEKNSILRGIKHAGDMALEMMEKLLEYSLEEHGTNEIKKEVLDMEEAIDFVRSVIHSYTLKSDYDLEVGDYMPKYVYSNGERLRRIAATLISNAYENANGRPVYTSIYYMEESSNKGTLDLEVTGYGNESWSTLLAELERFLNLPEEEVDCASISEGLELYNICRMARNLGGDVVMETGEDGMECVHAFVQVEVETGSETLIMKK